jgi:hypothetical protein
MRREILERIGHLCLRLVTVSSIIEATLSQPFGPSAKERDSQYAERFFVLKPIQLLSVMTLAYSGP